LTELQSRRREISKVLAPVMDSASISMQERQAAPNAISDRSEDKAK
jgi:hypothetical protein